MAAGPRVAGVLSRFPGLQASPFASDLAVLSPHLEEWAPPAGEPIVTEGKVTDHVYWVAGGRVAVTTDQGEGRQALLGYCSVGDVIGEASFLDGQPATATATSEDGTVLLRLSRRDAQAWVGGDPRAGAALYSALSGALAGRIRAATDRLDELWHPEDTPASEAIPGGLDRVFDALRRLVGAVGR